VSLPVALTTGEEVVAAFVTVTPFTAAAVDPNVTTALPLLSFTAVGACSGPFNAYRALRSWLAPVAAPGACSAATWVKVSSVVPRVMGPGVMRAQLWFAEMV